MIASNTALFFRFLNFFIIVFFIWYVVKKYVLPYFEQKIEEEHHEKETLKEKQHMLEKNVSELDSIIAKERVLYDQLQNKITAWRAIVDQKKKEESELFSSLKHEALMLQSEQRKNMELYISYVKEAKEIINTIEEEIKQKFHNKDTIGKFYVLSLDQFCNQNKKL